MRVQTSPSFGQTLPANEPSSYRDMYMSIAKYHTYSKKTTVHPTLTATNVHILDALKITYCWKISKYELTNKDFDNIDIVVIMGP